MPICVISTVGQSVITNSDVAINEGVKAFAAQTGHSLEAIRAGKLNFPGHEWHDVILANLEAKRESVDLIRKASAELNSLERILTTQPAENSDILHFLASDTPDGVLAARIVADFCIDYFNRETRVHVVDGLQVRDGKRFRREGLPSLVKVVYDILGQAPAGSYRRVLNPTGGYKGVVPYLTVIGMLDADQDLEISYIYEKSPELISLAGLPLQFDLSLIESAYDVLDRCSMAPDGFSEDELQSALDGVGAPKAAERLWTLFEAVGDRYVLSGLGFIFYQRLKTERARSVIYLSQQAARDFEKLDTNLKKQYARIFDQMRDAQWREQNLHATIGDKCKVLKASGDERPCFFEEGNNSILIVELTRHSDRSYERLERNVPMRKAYSSYMKWEGSKKAL